MDPFSNQKKQCLQKIDQSRKGQVDKSILPLVNLINRHADYYTTSSCAGRIVLLAKGISARKCDSTWLYSVHGRANLKGLNKALSDVPDVTVWLRQESFIIHVAARDMSAAQRLLAVSNEAGLKHSGVISIGGRIILELVGNENLAAPVANNGCIKASDGYLTFLIQVANGNMKSNGMRLKLLQMKIRKLKKK